MKAVTSKRIKDDNNAYQIQLSKISTNVITISVFNVFLIMYIYMILCIIDHMFEVICLKRYFNSLYLLMHIIFQFLLRRFETERLQTSD